MNTITQLPSRSNVQATTNVSTLDSQATAQSDSSIQYRPCDTLAVVDALKASSQDHEFFPSTKAHIDQVTADIDDILKTHEFSARYRDEVKILDIGAGDGRVLQWMEEAPLWQDSCHC